MASRRDAIGLVSGQVLMGPLLEMEIPPDIPPHGSSYRFPREEAAFTPLGKHSSHLTDRRTLAVCLRLSESPSFHCVW